MRILKIFVLSFLLLLVLVACNRKKEESPTLDNQNVLFIIVDTLSARHLGSYNSEITHTPNLDQLANDGVQFNRFYAAAPWTKPSISSIFTGLAPREHGVKRSRDRMSNKFTTMAELFSKKGYDTGAVISHVLIEKKYGYAQGFNDYKNVNFRGQVHASITSDKVTDEAIKWLSDRSQAADNKKNEKQPFFLFLHYFDPHFYYQDHEQFDFAKRYTGKIRPGMHIKTLRALIPELSEADVNYIRQLFNEEVAYTDQELGRLLAYLKQAGIEDDTLIVVLADHGEEFMEHGWIGHTRTLYDELVHVPLIFKHPKLLKPGVVEGPAAHVDLLPTLMSWFKEPISDPAWHGISLLGALQGKADLTPTRAIYSEVDFASANKVKDTVQTAIIKEPFKLVHDRTNQKWSLFKRDTDPKELKDVKDNYQTLFTELKEELLAYESGTDRRGSHQSEEVDIDDEEVEQLKSLGYM